LGEAHGAILFDDRKKWREAGDEFGRVRGSGQRGWILIGSAFQSLVEAFLEARGVDIETEDLGGERMLGGQVFRAPDAPLPGSFSHGAIMGLGLGAGNCIGKRSLIVAYRFPDIDGGAEQRYSSRQSWAQGSLGFRFFDPVALAVRSKLVGGCAMELSRRTFLKGALVGGAGFSLLGFDLTPAVAQLKELKIARATETRSTCPYCAVSCGVLIYTIGDKAKNVTPQVIHVEGDPDHPINRGTLCPKGASLEQDILNPRRLLKPQVRRPGSDHWEDIAWSQAIDEIAQRVKKTRDDTFITQDAQGRTVNRCESMAWIGGCTDTNEFNYLVVKTMRALGLTYMENQARV
jgi:formate dehydrogenase major subunit